MKNIFSTKTQIHINEQIKTLTDIYDRINKNVKLGKTYTYNCRYSASEELWKPTLKNTIEHYKNNIEKTMKKPEYDLIYRSRYGNTLTSFVNDFIQIFNGSTQTIVMSDFIIFNKNYNIDFLEVDRLLPYCKIKVTDNEKYILDGWNYELIGFYEIDTKLSNKIIKFDMTEYENMELVKTEEEKRLAVRALIQIMNEIPEEEINLHNYYTISEWYSYYDANLTSYNNNIYNLKNSKCDEKLVGPLFININKLLTKKHILEILYVYAKYGSGDYYHMFGKTDTTKITDDDINKNTINEASIYTEISNEKLDLTNYFKYNGGTRTNNVINEINRLVKNKIICSFYKADITPEELVVEIHNNTLPFNAGFLDHTKKQITTKEASEILKRNNNYIDYLNGIPYKLDFSNFPIIDIKKFDDRNGKGHIIKCLKNIK